MCYDPAVRVPVVTELWCRHLARGFGRPHNVAGYGYCELGHIAYFLQGQLRAGRCTDQGIETAGLR